MPPPDQDSQGDSQEDTLETLLDELDELSGKGERPCEPGVEDMLRLVGLFNRSMLGNVDGPSCTDRDVCGDNCCSIMIDVPRFLAAEWIKRGYLSPDQVRRGGVFSWTLAIDESTNRCCFYDPGFHGCRIYRLNLGLRPPQCAIYPAGFVDGAESCKAGAGPWVVKDRRVGEACKALLEHYKEYCLEERQEEKDRFLRELPGALRNNLAPLLEQTRPSEIAGVRDTWNGLVPLHAEGMTLSFKRFCVPSCQEEYLECNAVCPGAARSFLDFLERNIPRHVNDVDMEEKYLIADLARARSSGS